MRRLAVGCLWLQGGVTPMRKLRVAYMLPHHNITGGMKCLVEHIRLLRARGHRTIAVHRCASVLVSVLCPTAHGASCCAAIDGSPDCRR